MKFSELQGNSANPGLIFVPELIELRGLNEPVAIGEFAQLRRVDGIHKSQLKTILQPYIQLRGIWGINPWESEEIPQPVGGPQIVPIATDEEQQYWVLMNWRKLYDGPLNWAVELADPSLTPVLGLMNPGASQSGFVNRHAIFNWLDDRLPMGKKIISPEDINEIEKIVSILVSFEQNQNPDFYFIHKALADFDDIKSVTSRKPLYVVGLFSIIESLLATDQANKSGKSISHQLREKISLMNYRFQSPLLLSDFFGNSKDLQLGKVVSKLYDYRSDIAHGNSPDFKNGLGILVNHESVCRFLHTLVRRLIIQAVKEPELMRDLRKC